MARITYHVISRPGRVDAWIEDGDGAPRRVPTPDFTGATARELELAAHRLAEASVAGGAAAEALVYVDGESAGAHRPAGPAAGPKVLKGRPPAAELAATRRGHSAVWDVSLRSEVGAPLGIEDCLSGARAAVLAEMESVAQALVAGGGYRRVRISIDGRDEGDYSAA